MEIELEDGSYESEIALDQPPAPGDLNQRLADLIKRRGVWHDYEILLIRRIQGAWEVYRER